MKLSGLTSVRSASAGSSLRSSRRAAYSPTYPPPTMRTLAATPASPGPRTPYIEATRGAASTYAPARLRRVRAARFVGPGRSMEVQEVPDPVPGPSDVVVRVEACGICASDLHFIHGEMPLSVAPPIPLGHEA